MNNEENIIFIKEYYGEEAQANQIVQELSELVVAITKNDLTNIKEEIADVEIMVEQFELFKAINKKTYNDFKESIRNNKIRKIDISRECIEHNLKLICLELAIAVEKEDTFKAITDISKLEIIINSFINIKDIDRNDIEKIKNKKIERQIKRIEDTERNKKIAGMRK